MLDLSKEKWVQLYSFLITKLLIIPSLKIHPGDQLVTERLALITPTMEQQGMFMILR